jgi:hypothetical protein
MLANPSKTKKKSLRFLVFPWPKRGFSKGYNGKIKKSQFYLRLHADGSNRLPPLPETASSFSIR